MREHWREKYRDACQELSKTQAKLDESRQAFSEAEAEIRRLQTKLDSARLAISRARNFLVNTYDRDEAVVILTKELSEPGTRAKSEKNNKK